MWARITMAIAVVGAAAVVSVNASSDARMTTAREAAGEGLEEQKSHLWSCFVAEHSSQCELVFVSAFKFALRRGKTTS